MIYLVIGWLMVGGLAVAFWLPPMWKRRTWARRKSDPIARIYVIYAIVVLTLWPLVLLSSLITLGIVYVPGMRRRGA